MRWGWLFLVLHLVEVEEAKGNENAFMSIGRSGTGKSSLLNALLCPTTLAFDEEDCDFITGTSKESKTGEIDFKTGPWLDGTGDYKGYSTLYDTPGFLDSGEKDCQTLEDIVNVINGHTNGFFSTFILVIKAIEQFDSQAQMLLKRLQYIFGDSFYDHVMINFSWYSFSTVGRNGIKERKVNCVNNAKNQRNPEEAKKYCESLDYEKEKTEEILGVIKSSTGINTTIPTFFIDSHYDPTNRNENATFFRYSNKLMSLASRMERLICDKDCKKRLNMFLSSKSLDVKGMNIACKPECVINSECPKNLACAKEKCQDPCQGVCGRHATCAVQNHEPICNCEPGYTGDECKSGGGLKNVVMMALGRIKTGKSSLLNALLCLSRFKHDESCHFTIGTSVTSMTKEIDFYAGPWLSGRGDYKGGVTLYDTPGYSFSDKQDCQALEDIAHVIKEHQNGHFSTFIIVIKSTDIFDSQAQRWFKALQYIFGDHFYDHVVINFSWYNFNAGISGGIKKRMHECEKNEKKKGNLDGAKEHCESLDYEKEKTEEIMRVFKNTTGLNLIIPTFFIDSHYDPEYTKETEIFIGYSNKLIEVASRMGNFLCEEACMERLNIFLSAESLDFMGENIIETPCRQSLVPTGVMIGSAVALVFVIILAVLVGFVYKRRKKRSQVSGFYRQRSILAPDHKPFLDKADYSNLEEYEAFQEHIELKIKSLNWTPMTFSALSDISQIFGIIITPGTLSLTSLTTTHLKEAMEIDGRLHKVSDSALVNQFKEAIDYLELKSFDLALEKFKRIVNNIQNSKNDDIHWNIHAGKVFIFSQLMVQMYNKDIEYFQPLEKMDEGRKKLCCRIITERFNLISNEIARLKKMENILDPLYRVVYPVLSVCRSFTNPRNYLTDLPDITIQPKYIPIDEFEATALPMGLVRDKEQMAFVWRKIESKDRELYVRVASRVFKVPFTNMDEVMIEFKIDPSSLFFTCSTKNRDGDKIPCNHENVLPTGISSVQELMKELEENPTYASSETYVKFSRLGPFYLKELAELDFNQTNIDGNTLLFLVAYHGRVDLLRNLLDAGVDMKGGKEPTYLRIAGEGNSLKHRKILKELIVRHKYAGIQDIANDDGHTALHKAVLSNNKNFVKDLIQGKLDNKIMDNEGNTALDWAKKKKFEKIKKLLQAAE